MKRFLYITFDIGDTCGSIVEYLREIDESFLYLSIFLHDIPHSGSHTLYKFMRNERICLRSWYTPRSRVAFVNLNIFRIIWEVVYKNPGRIIVSMNPLFLFAAKMLTVLGVRVGGLYFIVGDSPFIARGRTIKHWLLQRIFCWAVACADKVWFITPELEATVPPSVSYSKKNVYRMPFGVRSVIQTSPSPQPQSPLVDVLYIGNLSREKSGGLLEYLQSAVFRESGHSVTVCGAGELWSDFHVLAKQNPQYITTLRPVIADIEVAALISRARVGIALYDGETRYYGDPAKIKLYIQHGKPVIFGGRGATAEDIATHGAGVVVPHVSPQFVENALVEILSSYADYVDGVRRFCSTFDYRKINNRFFL